MPMVFGEWFSPDSSPVFAISGVFLGLADGVNVTWEEQREKKIHAREGESPLVPFTSRSIVRICTLTSSD